MLKCTSSEAKGYNSRENDVSGSIALVHLQFVLVNYSNVLLPQYSSVRSRQYYVTHALDAAFTKSLINYSNHGCHNVSRCRNDALLGYTADFNGTSL